MAPEKVLVAQDDAARNRAAVEEFLQMAFHERKPDLASRLFARSFIDHDPASDGTRDGYLASLTEFVATYPFLQFSVRRTIADAEHVVVHAHVVPEPGDRGQALVDVFRLEAAKIVEHWRVRQDVPARTQNRNPMV